MLAYGTSRKEAVERAQALSLRVLADRLEHGEAVPQMGDVFAACRKASKSVKSGAAGRSRNAVGR